MLNYVENYAENYEVFVYEFILFILLPVGLSHTVIDSYDEVDVLNNND